MGTAYHYSFSGRTFKNGRNGNKIVESGGQVIRINELNF
jgi:hypothetical protein